MVISTVMRYILVLFVVASVMIYGVLGDDKFHCCGSIFSGLCPGCYGMYRFYLFDCSLMVSIACPNTVKPVENMEKLLKQRIFGQDEAIQMITTAFRAHDKTKPLTFHFAGGMSRVG